MKGRPGRAGAFGTRLALGLVTPLALLLAYLPLGLGQWVGARLGDLGWLLLPGRRAVALDNLSRALGAETTPRERARIGRESFRNLGMNVVEACVFYFRPPARLLSRVEVQGVDHLMAAAALGRGVLGLTAHLGNWELLGAAAHTLTPVRLSAVYRPLDDPVLDPILERFRARVGVEMIGKRNAVTEIRDALRRGRLVGVLLDQNASRRESVFAPFFGMPASTSKGFALIARRTGAPVVPSFIHRTADGRHVAEFRPALPVPADGDLIAYTRAFNEAIEAAVRRNPGQWFWVHRRWKTRPPEPA
jgi:Kdo2-lipid IVA lauroyltransferase/acyltransferase